MTKLEIINKCNCELKHRNKKLNYQAEKLQKQISTCVSAEQTILLQKKLKAVNRRILDNYCSVKVKQLHLFKANGIKNSFELPTKHMHKFSNDFRGSGIPRSAQHYYK